MAQSQIPAMIGNLSGLITSQTNTLLSRVELGFPSSGAYQRSRPQPSFSQRQERKKVCRLWSTRIPMHRDIFYPAVEKSDPAIFAWALSKDIDSSGLHFLDIETVISPMSD